MEFQPNTVINFYGAAFLWMAAISLIGVPIWCLMSRISSIGRAISPPIYGIGLLMSCSWYWAEPGGALRPMLRALIIVGAVIGAGMLARNYIGPSRAETRRGFLRATPVVLVCILSMTFFSLLDEGGLLSLPHPTVPTLYNADPPSYAFQSQHLLDHGPSSPGAIVGFDAGARSLGFTFGSYVSLGSAGVVTGQPVWKVMQPAFFALITLLALALADALTSLLGRRWRWAAVVASVAALGRFTLDTSTASGSMGNT